MVLDSTLVVAVEEEVASGGAGGQGGQGGRINVNCTGPGSGSCNPDVGSGGSGGLARSWR